MWNHSYPSRDDYETEEEYQEAVDYYESAESAYIEEGLERYYENKYK